MTLKELEVKGTPLPFLRTIPAGFAFKLRNWANQDYKYFTEDKQFINPVSHGIVTNAHGVFVLVDEHDYTGANHYMFHVDDLLPFNNNEIKETEMPTKKSLDKVTTEDFDIDRLAKEIDEAFQTVSTVKEKQFSDKLDAHFVEMLENGEAILEDSKVKIKTIIDDSISTLKDNLIEEISKGRAIINIDNKLEVPIHHMDHPRMEDVIKNLAIYKKSMLVGPAGTGKTTIVQMIADRMKLPFYKYSCSRDSSVHDLLGYKQPKSETYLNTNFLECYENGGIFLVDEYDAMSGDMALFFNGVADNSPFISVPHRDEKPQAVKHENFYLIMCGNTWGRGSYEYTGRDFQDKALMDRFRYCRQYVDYHEKLEKSLAKTNYPFIKRLRSKLEAIGSYLSTRNVEDICKSLSTGISQKDIVITSVFDLPEADKHLITSQINTIIDEKTTSNR